MKTYQPKQKEVKRNWHLVDLSGKTLGRVSTQIATFLMGKHKPTFSKHMDMGDYVVAINAKKIEVTGKKEKQKVYYKHSGYPGGFKEVSYAKMMEDDPRKVIIHSVSGMLPKNRLQGPRLKRFKVFVGENHPYGDQIKSG